MSKVDLMEIEEIGEEKFKSKLEEQVELKRQFEEQEKNQNIVNAINLLLENGYSVEKV